MVVVEEAQEPIQGCLVCGSGKVGDPSHVLLDGGDAILDDVVAEEVDGGLEELGPGTSHPSTSLGLGLVASVVETQGISLGWWS